jgi:hypothetical protein
MCDPTLPITYAYMVPHFIKNDQYLQDLYNFNDLDKN